MSIVLFHPETSFTPRAETVRFKLEARIIVGEWIEAFYNRRRIHTSIGEIPKKAMDDFLTTPVTTAAQAVWSTN